MRVLNFIPMDHGIYFEGHKYLNFPFNIKFLMKCTAMSLSSVQIE